MAGKPRKRAKNLANGAKAEASKNGKPPPVTPDKLPPELGWKQTGGRTVAELRDEMRNITQLAQREIIRRTHVWRALLWTPEDLQKLTKKQLITLILDHLPQWNLTTKDLLTLMDTSAKFGIGTKIEIGLDEGELKHGVFALPPLLPPGTE